jgi:hypothetical protein
LGADGREAVRDRGTGRRQTQSLTGLLNRIVADCQYPARLVELYYWSAEPELVEVMRHYLALPAEARATLHMFLSLSADDPNSVKIRAVRSGELRLSSRAAAELPDRLARQGASSTAAH